MFLPEITTTNLKIFEFSKKESVLDPLLFTIYINDLQDVVYDPSIFMTNYADNTPTNMLIGYKSIQNL